MRLFCIVILLFILDEVHGQVFTGKNAMLSVKHTRDFTINGEGNAAAWKEAVLIPLVNRNGNHAYTTALKILYSDKGVYFLFLCQDKKITATLKEDFADLFKEDVVELFLWPDETTPLYLEYELSPLNYELAIMVPNFQGNFFGWRPWHYEGDRKTMHAVHTTKSEHGNVLTWTAEIFIPYALLQPLKNVPPKKGTQWRANFYRIDYDQEISYWSWQPFEHNFHDFEMYGTLTFE